MGFQKLGKYLEEYTNKNKNNDYYPVYSVTNEKGFCKDFFSKDVSSNNKTNYKIVPKGYFAYNPSRINVGSIDWQNNEENVVVSPIYVVFRCKEELDRDYLKFCLKSQEGLRLINAKMTSSVRNNLKFNVLSEFKINIVSIKEQQSIVNLLKNIESAILNEKHLLALYDELAKSRFVELFGDPILESNNLKISSLLSDFCDLKAGDFTPAKDISEKEDNDHPYPCFGGNGIRGYVDNFTKEGTFPIIGRQGALCGNVNLSFGRFRNTEHAVLVTPKIQMNTVWLFKKLELLNLNRLCIGAAQPGLSVGKLNKIPFTVPPVDEQNKYADILKNIDKLKKESQNRIQLYKELFEKKSYEYFFDRRDELSGKK